MNFSVTIDADAVEVRPSAADAQRFAVRGLSVGTARLLVSVRSRSGRVVSSKAKYVITPFLHIIFLILQT
jgi:hypothetical protein